jgi:hypothetical protein
MVLWLCIGSTQTLMKAKRVYEKVHDVCGFEIGQGCEENRGAS